MFKCPHCEQATISYKQKYLMGIWSVIRCPNCGTRLSAQPLLLMALDVGYVWNAVWWLGLYFFNREPIYFVYLVIGWLILDFLNVKLIPIAALRSKPS